jgi:hypothetical protein
MTEVDETHICIDCTIIQEELKSQDNVRKKQATEIPHKDDEKVKKKHYLSWHQVQQNYQSNPGHHLNPEYRKPNNKTWIILRSLTSAS